MLHRYVDTYFNENLNNSKYFFKKNPNKHLTTDFENPENKTDV